MDLIIQGFAWIFTPAHWTTTVFGTGILDALTQHLILTGISLFFTILIAIPIGFYIGHTGRGRGIAIILSNVARALPTLGLLSVLILFIPDVAGIPSNYIPNIVVFVLLGIPALLAGAYAGLESVDRQTIDAARAVGMTEWQILQKVEIPLGAALIVGGLRATSLQLVSTVTISSLLGQVSLGSFISNGVATNDYPQMMAGAILVAALALIIDGLLAVVQRFVVPRGVSRGANDRRNTTARGRKAAAATQGTPITEGI
ncbi:MAG: transporter permease [Glaciihabitans sp.]|nr:transporter permease [Glaciihabitans sp.]